MNDLEQALRELDVEWPATPDIAAAVRTRIATERPRRRFAWPSHSWRAQLAYVAAVLLLLFAGTMAVSPDARSTVLEWLGLKSVEIRREEPTATPPPRSELGESLRLGEPTTLAKARASRAAPVLVPAELGDPDAVYETTLPEGTVATSLVYRPRLGLPASEVTGVALLVQSFRASVSPFIEKTIGSATDVERLTVDGAPAYWVTGAHGFAYQSEHDVVAYEDQRLADRTLLVERRDGVLLRIEGPITRARAIAVARSVRA